MKALKVGILVLAIWAFSGATAWAQVDAEQVPGTVSAQVFRVLLGGALGSALVIIGAGYGIGRLAASAVESMARQPEVAANIQTAMIIAAALIEGVTFFALIICIIRG